MSILKCLVPQTSDRKMAKSSLDLVRYSFGNDLGGQEAQIKDIKG